MANKRMFAKEIIQCDEFLDMPLGSQALYFHLGMNADDDGFVQPKSVMRLCQAKDDELKILIVKGFVISFDNLVVVITHWHINNYLQNDRYKPTMYQELVKQLGRSENKTYIKISTLPTLDTTCIQPVYSMDTPRIQNGYSLDTSCIQSVSKMEAQYSIDKSSIDKIRKEKEPRATKVAFDFSGFSNKEIELINTWLQYKNERREAYKPTGLKMLRTRLLELQVKNQLISAITKSITNGWKGLFDDKGLSATAKTKFDLSDQPKTVYEIAEALGIKYDSSEENPF